MDGTGQKPSTAAPKAKRITIFGKLPSGHESFAWIFPGGTEPKDLTEGNEITVSEVLGWFREAAPNWPAPPTDSPLMRSFTCTLNVLRLSEPFQADMTSPEHQRTERVKKAIRTLLSDLPPMIEGARKSREHAREMGRTPPISDAHAAAVVRLLEAAQEAEGAFFWPMPRKRNELWHDSAMIVAASARWIWHSVGREKVGKEPTSPLVRLIAEALPRIGEGERTVEAISKALRRHEGFTAEIDYGLSKPAG